MLKLKDVKSNYLVLDVNDSELLFSYTTCVAGFLPGQGYFKTDAYFSNTTSKHINQYLGKRPFIKIEQTEIIDLLKNINVKC